MPTLTLLGTKGGPSLREEGPSFLPTSNHLAIAGRSIVVDCGIGVSAALVRAGVALPQITDIFITHYHSDHVLELGGLLHTAWTSGLKTPIHVYGPVGLTDVMNGFYAMMSYDIHLRIADEGRVPLMDLIHLHEFGANAQDRAIHNILETPDLKVEAMRVEHPPVTQTYALKFSGDGRVITFGSDTAALSELAEFARHSDVLVHEAMHEKGIAFVLSKTRNADDRLRQHLLASHTFAADAAALAQRAQVKRLVFNHLLPPERHVCSDADWHQEVTPHFDGPFDLGYDGLKITL
ncbi:MAG: MBL fold metallo-hydrolase [Paracoccaceae bacterium]